MQELDTENVRVIELVAKPRSLEFNVQNEGLPTIGDQICFSNDVYRDDVQVGFDAGVCTIVRVDGDLGFMNCNVTLSLPEGLITAQVLKDGLLPPPNFVSAITGGTGEYAGAREVIRIDPNSPEIHYYRLEITTESVIAATVA